MSWLLRAADHIRPDALEIGDITPPSSAPTSPLSSPRPNTDLDTNHVLTLTSTKYPEILESSDDTGEDNVCTTTFDNDSLASSSPLLFSSLTPSLATDRDSPEPVPAACPTPPPIAPMAILPIGSHADLARSFGWQSSQTDLADPSSFPLLQQTVVDAVQTKLDRWEVCMTTEGLNSRPDQVTMCNFMSIGFLEARVDLKLHSMADKHPTLFFNRSMSKMWYAAYGSRAAMSKLFSNAIYLAPFLILRIDGRRVPIDDDVEGIVLLNVPSYCGGMYMWGRAHSPQPPSPSDGLIEVIGVRSVTHFARIKSSLDHGIRLGQGSRVSIDYVSSPFSSPHRPLPVNIDGTSWLLQTSTNISVQHAHSVSMLAKRGSAGETTYKALKVGWLKKSVDLVWKPRYFTVKNHTLRYYLTPFVRHCFCSIFVHG